VPIFNELLSVGIPLPAVDGLALVNATIAAGDGYINLAADFTFAPSVTSSATVGSGATNSAGRRGRNEEATAGAQSLEAATAGAVRQ
jgi:hypothetical protein